MERNKRIEIFQNILETGFTMSNYSPKDIYQALTSKIAKEPEVCCCGDSLTLGVVHRKDKPCYIPAEEKDKNIYTEIEELDLERFQEGYYINYLPEVIERKINTLIKAVNHLKSAEKKG